MYTYSAYDLRLHSAFELPELPAVDATDIDPDVEIVRDSLEPVPEHVEGTGGRRIEATPDAVRLTYDSIGSFRVESGTRIACDAVDETAENREFFRRLIQNELLGLTLYQRDHLVLHASAVSVDGEAAVFIGERGAGKSTTAAAFGAAGHAVLEDDVVAIRFDNGVPTVVPGVPQLRLKSDATTALDLEATATPSEESWYEKRLLRTEDVPGPAPLRGCYLLSDGEECMLRPISGREQILNLLAQTHARGLLTDTDYSSTHFNQCSQLTDAVAVQRLHRPREHECLSTVVELVDDDMKKGQEQRSGR